MTPLRLGLLLVLFLPTGRLLGQGAAPGDYAHNLGEGRRVVLDNALAWFTYTDPPGTAGSALRGRFFGYQLHWEADVRERFVVQVEGLAGGARMLKGEGEKVVMPYQHTHFSLGGGWRYSRGKAEHVHPYVGHEHTLLVRLVGFRHQDDRGRFGLTGLEIGRKSLSRRGRLILEDGLYLMPFATSFSEGRFGRPRTGKPFLGLSTLIGYEVNQYVTVLLSATSRNYAGSSVRNLWLFYYTLPTSFGLTVRTML